MKKCSATRLKGSKSHYYLVERKKKNILARRPKVLPGMEHGEGWHQKLTSASSSVV